MTISILVKFTIELELQDCQNDEWNPAGLKT